MLVDRLDVIGREIHAGPNTQIVDLEITRLFKGGIIPGDLIERKTAADGRVAESGERVGPLAVLINRYRAGVSGQIVLDHVMMPLADLERGAERFLNSVGSVVAQFQNKRRIAVGMLLRRVRNDADLTAKRAIVKLRIATAADQKRAVAESSPRIKIALRNRCVHPESVGYLLSAKLVEAVLRLRLQAVSPREDVVELIENAGGPWIEAGILIGPAKTVVVGAMRAAFHVIRLPGVGKRRTRVNVMFRGRIRGFARLEEESWLTTSTVPLIDQQIDSAAALIENDPVVQPVAVVEVPPGHRLGNGSDREVDHVKNRRCRDECHNA